jgi:uncharacterized repeat protein (TIGR01451 family)
LLTTLVDQPMPITSHKGIKVMNTEYGAPRRWRRGLGLGLAAMLITTAMAVLAPTVASAAGTTLFNQPFHNNSADGTGAVVLPALPAGAAGTNFACLTAAGNTTTGSLKSCAVAPDAQGAGKLRLTDTSTNTTGGLFAAASVPTSQGLDVTFNTYQWGGNNADGMGFALAAVDPASPVAPATIGQSGGALGYSGTKGSAGLANGYLGIGFDVFGNFSTSTYEGTGCVDPAFIATTGGKVAGQVVVRGPGRGTVGYCALNSTATNTSSPVVPLRSATRAASAVPVEVVINPTASVFLTTSGLIVAAGTYKVVFTPVGAVIPRTLEGALPVVPAGLYPSASWLNANGVPRQLAFGWVGSTGSVVDNHELDNAKVVSFNPVPDLNVTQTSFNGASPQPGDPVTYSVVAGVDNGANETLPIMVTETLPSGTVPVGAFGSGWVCQAPSGRKITCTNSNTPFANGGSLPPITIVGIVTGGSVTPSVIQTTSVATSASDDGNPGFSSATTAGAVPATPTGITVTPASSTIAGGVHVIVGGTNIAGANAIEIGTTAEQQAGTPVTLLPCQSGPAAGCFTVNGDGTLDISSMPARASAATVTVTVVTRGVAGSDTYVYTDKPAAPAAPTATAGLASATVSWVAPASNGSPITGYNVTPIRNGVAQTPISFDDSTTTRTLTGLTVGASYTFTVAAVNALGTGPASPASAAVVPFSLPGQPTITSVSARDSGAALSWTAPANGGSPITSYIVTPFIGNTAQTPQTFAGAGTAQTVTGLTPGTTYTFTVTATNAGGAGPPSARSTSVVPNASPSLSNPAPPAGEVGAAYSDALTVTDGTSPFAWSVSAGTLPPGLALAAGTGLLSGAPTAAGSFTFTVKVTDASGQMATQALTVVISPAPTLTFPAPPPGQVGIAYSAALTVTGGTGPFVWSISAGGLPPGLNLTAGTGLLSGAPTAVGSYSFTVRVVDAFGQAATKTVTLAITDRPGLSFPPPPAGQVGVAYNHTLTVTGGTAPYQWSVTAGSLPPGLALDADTGVLSGTPTTVGSFPFTVRVVDATGQAATEAVTLVITAGPLVVVKTADRSSVVAGGTVHYSITVTNTGSSAFAGVTITDSLGGVLDDATYGSDATATGGAVSFAGSAVTWTGNLAAGASETITYSVTATSPDTGDRLLANTVTSSTLGTNCSPGSPDARCAVSVPVAALTIAKTADVATASPGDVVHYTLVVTNSGRAAYTGAAFADSLAEVLDDAAYDGDATATVGAVSFTNPRVTWSGNLAVGQAATITYSVTVSAALTGDLTMTDTITSATPGNNCPSGGQDPRCANHVGVLVPGLVVTTTANAATTTPGAAVGYTVTIANNGQTAYTGIAVTSSLAGVLDDAVYHGDATATSGALAYASPNLTWTGSIAVGASATVTFTVTVSDPDAGDKVLTSVVTSAAAGNNCMSGSADPRCVATVIVRVPGLTIVKTASPASTTPGSVVAYTITVTDTGQTPYFGATFSDPLGGVLDDAVYNADAAATSGTAGVSGSALSWTGDLAVGASASITYSVTVSDPDVGDRTLTNTVVSTTAGSNCGSGGTDPRCRADVAVLRPGLTLSNVADAPTATPGSPVGFTVTIANSGETAYTEAHVTESLADVLDDATYDTDATASSGTVGVTGSDLTWTGGLAAGATATVRFSVTVKDPDPGTKAMVSTLVSGAVGSNCPAGGSDPACTVRVTVLLPGLAIVKTANATTATLGGTVGYTITVTNNGQTPYAGARLSDSLANVLNDATYNHDATVSGGTVSYASPTVSWVGDLAVGAQVSITYSVTILNPDPGDKTLVDTVVSTTPGSNCPAGSTDAGCTATVHVLVPALTMHATADTVSTAPGAVVGYTVTITNSGETPYAAATVTDALAGVVDDATYNGDALASAGAVDFAAPDLTWTGDLAPGAVVTITFSVTVADPEPGDLILTSTLTSPASGGNCPAGGDDPRCTVSVPVARLLIVTTTDVTTTTPGGVIRVDATYTNTGKVPYAGISVAFDATGFGDDVDGNGDQTASSGTLTVGGNGAVWTGDIPVGATITLSGSATVRNPDPGDHQITGTSTTAAPGSNCPAGGTDTRCKVSVAVLVPALTITKTADTATAAPGQTVHYTVTVTNSGQTPYTGISVTDPLTGVLDDATFGGDAVAGSGAVTYTEPDLTWTGDAPVGAVVTITYSVVVRSPDPGDKTMANTVDSTAVGSSCSASGRSAACTATVVVLTPALTIAKSADITTGTPGTTLTYTVKLTNSGQIDYTGISAADSLAGVLDDAAYGGDANATAGTLSYAAPVLTWTGDVAVGGTVTITYTVTVSNPDLGDQSLVDAVTSAAAGSNCPVGGTDPRCTVTTTVVAATTLTFTKTTDVASTTAGSVVHYTVTVANAGLTPYLGATFSDSLTDVLDDADYDGDASATGGAVTYAAPILSWTGDVPASGSIAVTYSVTVHGTGDGDDLMTNTLVSASPAGNCAAGSGDPRCSARVTVAELTMLNTADVASARPGDTVRFTTTLTNTGGTPYLGITVTLGGGDILDDADPTGEQSVSSGTTVIGPTGLRWTGDIPVGGVVTVSATFVVKDPDPGNEVMSSTITSAVPGGNCPSGGADPRCTATVAVLIPGLTITKAADRPFAVPGDTVGYTVTVTNSGTAPYTGAVVTDALTGTLDDASYGNDATATLGSVSYAAPALTWTGDLPVGAVAVISYTMTVRAPDPGDKTMVDRVVSTSAGSTCSPSSSNQSCTVTLGVLTPGLRIAISAAESTTMAGATVAYTVSIVNTGQTPQAGVTVTNTLAAVLDDATYDGDATASTGIVTFTSPDLAWTGSLAPGSTATVTYSVTVTDPDPGDHLLTSAVSSAAAGNNCAAGSTDPACAATVTVSELAIANHADVATTVPGGTVRFTTTATNTGQTPYTDISISAAFAGSLDDATYNGDAAPSTGSLVLVPATGTVRWTGDLAPGAILTVTGSFTVHDPDTGDRSITSIVSSAVPGNNCGTGSGDPACTATVAVRVPGLAILKTASSAAAVPGGTVGYTVTVTNTGETPYPAATVTDTLAGLLDDASYNGDVAATAGSVSYAAPDLTWSGALAVGATVRITYTVTVHDPVTGERVLTNAVTSTTSGSNCPPGGTDPACATTVTVLVPALRIVKTASAATITPGDTLGYTVTVTNTGQTPYTAATVTDALGGVLDDATYNNDATATVGAVTYAAPILTWTGDLAVGASAVIAYTVTAVSPAAGDRSLTNAVTSAAPGSNCASGSTDPDCAVTVGVLIPSLGITNVADVATAAPGGVIRFTATFTNNGPTPYTGIRIVTDAGDVFDDVRPNGDQVASTGTFTVVGTAVTWTGDIPVGGVVTVTGTVTVNQPDAGNHVVASTITTDAAGSNCPTASPGPDCTVTVTVLTPGLDIVKQADTASTTPGGVVTYTITATNTGQTAYTGAVLTDSLAGLLPDADFNHDATATRGSLAYASSDLTWTGDLPVGGAVTVRYTVTVKSPQVGGHVLTNVVTSDAAANNCPSGGTDPRCRTTVAILIPGLTITKSADTTTVTSGDTVTYTVEIANTGQSPYTAATVTDRLDGVLDDAAYGNDATVTVGDVSFADQVLTWTGDLDVGDTATVTYSVTANFPDTGDRILENTVTSATPGANCPVGGADPACAVRVTVLTPALTITKSADTDTVVAGGAVRYTVMIANSGQAPYTGATVVDSLADVIDDATYAGDAVATSGGVAYAAPNLTWTGDLPVNATAVVTFTVTTHQPATGDGRLVNAVTSSALASNCPPGGSDPRCVTSTDVAPQAITLTSLSSGFTLSGAPDTVVSQDGAVTMTVTTNSPTGYTVAVRAVTSALTAARPGNPDNIPATALGVRESGTATFQPLSDVATVRVHSQSGPSAAGGDAVSNDYEASIPFIATDTYSGTLEYIAITQ